MVLKGKLIIKCSSCGTEYPIDMDCLEEEVITTGEYGMGERIQYYFSGEMECD